VIKHGDVAIAQEIWAKRSLVKAPSKDSMIKRNQAIPGVVKSFDVLMPSSEKSLITQYQQSYDIVKSFDQTLIIIIAKRLSCGGQSRRKIAAKPQVDAPLCQITLKEMHLNSGLTNYFRTMLAEQLSTEELLMIDQKRLSKGKDEYIVLTLDDSL
jgi:hypothetical protein